MRKDNNIDIIRPENQLILHGYSSHFQNFTKLYDKKKLPQVCLLSGPQGLGKSTFIYHLINFILSKNEKNQYSVEKKLININNHSYKQIISNIHPNFIKIKGEEDSEKIKIEEARKLITFLNKSTFTNNIKLVLIDNSEKLNLNSSNAILKSLEEPSTNTFFFIIYNNLLSLPATIRSRSIEFKIFLNFNEKKDIFLNLKESYEILNITDSVIKNLYFDTPGNLLKYCFYVQKNKTETIENIYNNIFIFIEKYLKDKNYQQLHIISLFIEKFYNKLIYSSRSNKLKFFINRSKILRKINMLKKFNLDAKNIFLNIENILKNEAK